MAETSSLLRNRIYYTGTEGSNPSLSAISAPVAQLDRVLGYEPSGREFESLRARHTSIVKYLGH